MEEKWVTVKIGGYPRRCKKTHLEEVVVNAEGFKGKYVSMGIPQEEVDEIYQIEILYDEDE